MDIIAIAVALKKAISQTKDIIASHFVAGTNIEITDNPDGTQTINASGEVSATDEVARQAISDHEADLNNPHSVTKNQIGLGNVDNTSDADKPISAATQTALNGKQPTINSSNPLSSDLVDDANATHKFATAAELAQIAKNTGDINTINEFLENTKIESWNIADKGELLENTYVDTEGGGGITHSYEPYFTLIGIEIPAGATTLYFDCTALENQDAGAYSMFFSGSFEGFISTGKSIAIPNHSTKLDITFPYVDGDYTNKTKGKYYVSFETPTGKYDTITIDGVSTNVVPKEVFDDDLASKQDTISDLATIRSNASTGAEAAEVVTGINSTANSYIEMKSGIREYLSSAVPTGNIPIGSLGMGFDEGVWTYKSGTKSKSPIVVPHETTEIYDECTYTIRPSLCVMNAGKKYIHVHTEINIHSGWTRIAYGNLYCNDGTITDVSELTLENKEINPSIRQQVNKTGSNLEDIGMGVIAVNYVTLTNGTDTITRYTSQNIATGNYTDMFRDSSMPLYFYANGQPLINYTIYGADGGVGDRTANLFDGNFPDLSGTIQYMPVYVGDISVTLETTASASTSYDAQVFLLEGNVASGASSAANGVWAGNSRRVAAVNGYVTIAYRNLGTLAVPLSNAETWLFERFQLPIICGNTTTNIYIDNPLNDGDSIDYTTSQTAIPTVDGLNNLICDTTVQPSKVSLTYTGWHSDLDDTTARIEALENAPTPSGGMTYDTLYEGTTASSYPYPLSHPITDYKFIIIAVGYSNIYTNAVVPVAVWSTITGSSNNYDITVDTAQLRINTSEILARSSNNRILYGVYGIK